MTDIQMDALSFTYDERTNVLDHIALSFEGQSTALIGQNGAGKTTLVKLLKGLLKPTGGYITINGRDTSSDTVASLAAVIGLVFQNPSDQIFKNNVFDEVMFGPLNIGMSQTNATQQTMKALETVGMAEQKDDHPYDLSLSERKFISIASILAMDTSVVIFDEPTIAQDDAGREKVKEIIAALKRQGKLVITVIHDMDFVAEVFERTVVLQEGQVLLDADTRDVFSHAELLQQAGLAVPHVTKLAQALGHQQTYLTVDAFVCAYQ